MIYITRNNNQNKLNNKLSNKQLIIFNKIQLYKLNNSNKIMEIMEIMIIILIQIIIMIIVQQQTTIMVGDF